MPVINKRVIILVIATLLVLLIPLIAMQFTNEVNWSSFDFTAAGVLLLGTGFITELVIRKVTNIKYRIAIIAVLLLVLILVWLELAVGIFGTPYAGN